MTMLIKLRDDVVVMVGVLEQHIRKNWPENYKNWQKKFKKWQKVEYIHVFESSNDVITYGTKLQKILVMRTTVPFCKIIFSSSYFLPSGFRDR